jgi:hypothetical protein
MRTTLNLPDELLTQAKLHAARERTTVTALIEAGLRRELRRRERNRSMGARELPVFTGRQGIRHGVDLTSNVAMFDACDVDS